MYAIKDDEIFIIWWESNRNWKWLLFCLVWYLNYERIRWWLRFEKEGGKGLSELGVVWGVKCRNEKKKKNREPIIANVVSEIGFSHSFIIFPPYFNCPNGRTDLTHLSFLSVLFNAFSSPSYRILGSNIFEFPYLLKVILTFLDYNR